MPWQQQKMGQPQQGIRPEADNPLRLPTWKRHSEEVEEVQVAEEAEGAQVQVAGGAVEGQGPPGLRPVFSRLVGDPRASEGQEVQMSTYRWPEDPTVPKLWRPWGALGPIWAERVQETNPPTRRGLQTLLWTTILLLLILQMHEYPVPPSLPWNKAAVAAAAAPCAAGCTPAP